MSAGGTIKNLFKAIGKYVTQNPGQAAALVGAAAGTVEGAIGVGNAIAAKNTNKKAIAIYDVELKKYEKSEKEVRIILESLAEKQVYVASLFAEFSDLIEKIQQPPDGLFQGEQNDVVPQYNAKAFKILSNDARIVLDTIGGAAIGTTAGAAVTGLQIVVLGFSAFAAGTVLLIKGNSLRKKANDNYQRAEEIGKEVDAIIGFHSLLIEAAGQVAQSIDRIIPQYESHLNRMKEIVSHGVDWNDYSKDEERIIDNCVRLACCLNGLCIIKLTRKNEKGKDVVDSEKVFRLKEESQKILSIVDKFTFDSKNVAVIEVQ